MLITRVLHVMSCYCYHKGTYFQANHNSSFVASDKAAVVIATTKVRIFKQITTDTRQATYADWLLLLPQRYVFSSKSQPMSRWSCQSLSCYCYHKGTYFQANHNNNHYETLTVVLLLLPQRYVFSSKSQLYFAITNPLLCCYCYHKGTYFQANHNSRL